MLGSGVQAGHSDAMLRLFLLHLSQLGYLTAHRHSLTFSLTVVHLDSMAIWEVT